jgi:hypothetical protein
MDLILRMSRVKNRKKNNLKFDSERFEKIKKDAELNYRSINSVVCPFLKRKINFNVKGLDHIKFKSWNKTRLQSDQYYRLKFLKLAPIILEKTGTLQEYNETNSFERKKLRSNWSRKMVPVKYYGFIAILKYKIKVKVIVKEFEGGEPYFWSIIPFWKNKKDEINNIIKKVFHDGDLEND